MAFGKEIKLPPQDGETIKQTGEYALAAIVNDKLGGAKQAEYQQVVNTICEEKAGGNCCRLPNLSRLPEEIAKEEAEKLSTESPTIG